MKHKLTAAVLALSMIPQVAFASINASVGTDNDSITIFGNSDAYTVTIGVLKPGYTLDDIESGTVTIEEAVSFYRAVEVVDGKYSFEVPMPSGASDTGMYNIFAGSERLAVRYEAVSERLDKLDEVIDKKNEGTANSYLANNGVFFCDYTRFHSVSDKARLGNIASGMLDNVTLVSGSTQSLADVVDIMELSTVIERINEDLISDFAEIELVADNSKMNIKITEKDRIPEAKKADVMTRIKASDVITTEEGFYKAIEASLFIGVMNDTEMNSDDKRAYFESNAAFAGLVLTNYNMLDTQKRSSVVNQLVAAKTTSISSMQEKIGTLCSQEEPSVPPTSSDGVGSGTVGGVVGGTGGGGGGAVNTNKPSIVPSGETPVSTPEEPKYIPTISFADMEKYSWAEDAVKSLRNDGIVSGYSDGSFKPEGSVTRAEFITMIVKAFLSEYTGEEEIFGDVSKADWSYKYIMTAYENKLVSGMGEGAFLPNQNIKRSDMAVILNNLAKLKEKEISASDKAFDDAENIPDYAKDAVGILRGAGVINGDENNNFRPADFANRAEAAVMIYKFMEVMKEEQN